MAQINVTMRVSFTVASLTGQQLDQVLAWIQTNLKDKLPTTADLKVYYDMTP
jgi:hypothetical protein